MKAFISKFRIDDKFFLLILFMFLFLTKNFSQSTAEELNERSKNFADFREALKSGVDAAEVLSRDSFFSLAKIAIQYAGYDMHEHSITFGKDTTGKVTVSPIINGDPSSGRVNSNWPGAFADIHNHTNDQPPSAGDFYCLVKLNNKNRDYSTRFVVTISGTVYALCVYDLKLANDFIAKYPLEQTPGFSPRFPEPIFDDVDKISTYFEGKGVGRLTAQERALAFVLAKYNCGTILLKQDSVKKFLVIETEEITSKGVVSYIVHD